MEWFERCVGLMRRKNGCSGKEVVDWLQEESRTGYGDLEGVVGGLRTVGERAWVRGAVGWVVYGRVPGVGRGDFFVGVGENEVSSLFILNS